jgi:profilin
LQLTAAEMGAIAASFNDKSETKAVIANGVKVNGEKYMTIESSEDSLKAKKVPLPTSAHSTQPLTHPQGKEGIVAYKTTQALLIAHHPDSIQTPNAFNSVVELGEYLKKVGY